jgi:hypothetical protein
VLALRNIHIQIIEGPVNKAVAEARWKQGQALLPLLSILQRRGNLPLLTPAATAIVAQLQIQLRGGRSQVKESPIR